MWGLENHISRMRKFDELNTNYTVEGKKVLRSYFISDSSVEVYVDVFVNFISKINQEDMRYELGVYLRQNWYDSRKDSSIHYC